MRRSQSLERLLAFLNVDGVVNRVIDGMYRNARSHSGRFEPRFQILTYHKVSPDPHPFFAPVHPETFEQHIQFLKHSYNVMPLARLVEGLGHGDVPDRAVAITFDDGYRDNYEFAFPILKKYQLPATIFLATGAIETGKVLWHDRIFDSFRYTTVKRATVNDEVLGELVLHPRERLEQSLQSALNRVRTLYGELQTRMVDEIEDKLKPDFPAGHSETRMLLWDQIREMHGCGIDFGSHTVNHPIVSRLPREILFKELQDSKRVISEKLGAAVTTFAYPNGKPEDFNPEVKSALKECGYACAVTTERGVNRASTDPFELKRGQPWPDRIESFRLTLCLERHALTV